MHATTTPRAGATCFISTLCVAIALLCCWMCQNGLFNSGVEACGVFTTRALRCCASKPARALRRQQCSLRRGQLCFLRRGQLCCWRERWLA